MPEAERDPVAEIIVRCVTDEEFRNELTENPRRVFRILGVSMPTDFEAAIRSLSPEDWNTMSLREIGPRLDAALAGRRYRTIEVVD